jgi:hypothetical protein
VATTWPANHAFWAHHLHGREFSFAASWTMSPSFLNHLEYYKFFLNCGFSPIPLHKSRGSFFLTLEACDACIDPEDRTRVGRLPLASTTAEPPARSLEYYMFKPKEKSIQSSDWHNRMGEAWTRLLEV